ncbi:hypothetical protein ACFB49_47210 [Sphingomonas sp. DBB INV C78]|uniref:hypothetical protein n=1 Tax=Sphingomonas sp. DBB INV C78 TaxID=3349434 RepID=UPI0036D29248
MDRTSKSALHAALLMLVMLPGCGQTGQTYPSLAPRPVEKLSIEEPAPESSEPIPAANAPTDAQIATQTAAAESARGRFTEELAAAKRAVSSASGKAVDSEAWVAAQQALSRLDQTRGPVTTALASLDEMMVAAGGAPSPALADAWAKISALDDEQRTAFNALTAALTQP